MALASNTKDQLAKRLLQDLQLREPSWTTTLSVQTSIVPGDPLLTVSVSGSPIAVIAIDRRTFNGFNVVAELSSSAAEGLPEHIAYLLQDTGNSQLVTSKLAMYVSKLGVSSMKMGFVSGPTEAGLTAGNVSAEIPNDARYGAVGQ